MRSGLTQRTPERENMEEGGGQREGRRNGGKERGSKGGGK